MQDQHKKITGYRDLTQGEIDLMNAIKAKGMELEELVGKVQAHLAAQDNAADSDSAEVGRLDRAQPLRWAAIGRTHFQEGLMALTRAVAQPTSF